MGSREVVILSSSPARLAEDFAATPPSKAPARSRFSTASSESLPSPEQFFKTPSYAKLKSGSRSAAAPEGALLGFVSAGHFVAENGLHGNDEQEPEGERGRKKKTDKPARRAKRKVAETIEGPASPQRSRRPHSPEAYRETAGGQRHDDVPPGILATAIPAGAGRAALGSKLNLEQSEREEEHVSIGDELQSRTIEVTDSPPRAIRELDIVLDLSGKDQSLRYSAEKERDAVESTASLANHKAGQPKRAYLSSTYVRDSDSESEASSIAPDVEYNTHEHGARGNSSGTLMQPAPQPPEVLAPAVLVLAVPTPRTQPPEPNACYSSRQSLHRSELPDVPLINRVKAKNSRTQKSKQKTSAKVGKRKSTNPKPGQASIKPTKTSSSSKGVEPMKSGRVSGHFSAMSPNTADLLDGVPGQHILDLGVKVAKNDLRSNLEGPRVGSIDIKELEETLIGKEIITDEPVCSPEKAIARRRSWTPVENTSRGISRESPTASAVAQETSEVTERTTFKALLSNFSYGSGDSPHPPNARERPEKPPRRKRKAEAVERGAIKSPKAKKKTAKRKLTTITGLATEKYLPSKPDSSPSRILDLVAQTNPSIASAAGNPTFGAGSLNGPNLEQANKSTNSKGSSRKPNSKSRKDIAKVGLLLPPTKAMARVHAQDILFGTSSQLVQPENPSFIRDIQRAVRLSEMDPPNDFKPKYSLHRPTSLFSAAAQTESKKQGIWDAADRDIHGGLLIPTQKRGPMTDGCDESEDSVAGLPTGPADIPCERPMTNEDSIVNDDECDSGLIQARTHFDMYGAAISATQNSIPLNVRQSQGACGSEESQCRIAQMDEHFLDDNLPSEDLGFARFSGQVTQDVSGNDPISIVSQSNANLNVVSTNVDLVVSDASEFIDIDKVHSRPITPVKAESSFMDIDDLLSPHMNSSPRSSPPPIIPTTPARRKALFTIPSHPNIPLPTKPHSAKAFSTFTKASLQTSSAAETAKRPRGRPRKTQDTTSRVTDTTSKPNNRVEKTKSSIASPRKPRAKAKSKKDAIAAVQDEISDSEADCTPSPPRQHLSPSHSLELATAFDAQAAEAPNGEKEGWADMEARLFRTIKDTIRAEPRTSDVTKPSWQEKILLYDPIVLEDLTDWLNRKGVRLPASAAAGESVKSKGSSKRKTKTKKEDGGSLVEPWMVQKWCENLSICCLWKGGLRGGVRNRY